MELSELKEITLFESIMLMEKILKPKKDKRLKECRLSETNTDHVLVDLKDWNSKSIELLLKSTMVGIHNYYFNITQKRSLNVGSFNSVMDVVNGKEQIYLYLNSIKWLPKEIKEKLNEQGIEFEDLSN